MRARGQQIAGRRALVVGSGGVGSAIAFAVAGAGAASVAVSDLAEDRARDLAGRLTNAGYSARVSGPEAEGFDLVINASPAGMRAADPLPVDCTRAGCFVQPGTFMSDHQVAQMAEFFGFGPGDWSPEAIAEVTRNGTS